MADNHLLVWNHLLMPFYHIDTYQSDWLRRWSWTSYFLPGQHVDSYNHFEFINLSWVYSNFLKYVLGRTCFPICKERLGNKHYRACFKIFHNRSSFCQRVRRANTYCHDDGTCCSFYYHCIIYQIKGRAGRDGKNPVLKTTKYIRIKQGKKSLNLININVINEIIYYLRNIELKNKKLKCLNIFNE